MNEAAGKVALVTGASRGIGAAIAERLASEGAVVAVTARSMDAHPHLPGTLKEVVETIESRGGRAIAIQADLTRSADRERVVHEVESKLGPVDILINNAAASFYIPFEAYSEKRYQVAFELNVRAPFDFCQRVVGPMKEKRAGWIVNISSDTARRPSGPPFSDFAVSGGALLYGATKAALDRFSAGLGAELSRDNIFVNSLAPVAAVMTPGVEALGIVPEAYRASAEPVEAMAEAALALSTTSDPSMTGQVCYSLPLLEKLARAIKALDGQAFLES